MAKLSSINKNERRKKLVEKNAAKYAKLRAIADDESRDETERLIARYLMQHNLINSVVDAHRDTA